MRSDCVHHFLGSECSDIKRKMFQCNACYTTLDKSKHAGGSASPCIHASYAMEHSRSLKVKSEACHPQ